MFVIDLVGGVDLPDFSQEEQQYSDVQLRCLHDKYIGILIGCEVNDPACIFYRNSVLLCLSIFLVHVLNNEGDYRMYELGLIVKDLTCIFEYEEWEGDEGGGILVLDDFCEFEVIVVLDAERVVLFLSEHACMSINYIRCRFKSYTQDS